MGKTVISQLPLWHDHVYLQIVYIQFCCPKFKMKQMKEIISHGVHGSQHFLCGTCPIALLAHFPPPRCSVLSASPAFLLRVCCCGVPLSPLHPCTHSSFQIAGFSFRPTCAQTHCQPCMVSML